MPHLPSTEVKLREGGMILHQMTGRRFSAILRNNMAEEKYELTVGLEIHPSEIELKSHGASVKL